MSKNKNWWREVEQLVGDPDYDAIVNVWSWPDGGWMAGIIVIDKEGCRQQNLLAAVLDEAEGPLKLFWNMFDGFASPGLNAHGMTAEEAVQNLIIQLIELNYKESQ
jgi:hypothetical protein